MTIAPEARTCAAELNVKDLAIGHNGKTLLKQLTFSVPAGSSLAIVGEWRRDSYIPATEAD